MVPSVAITRTLRYERPTPTGDRFSMIKRIIRKILRTLANLPVIGRYIRMAAALYRIAAAAERNGQLSGELYKAASTAATPDADRDNLVASVPVALRKLRRDVDKLQAQIAELERKQG